MGINHLWPVLSVYCERKATSELKGKVVAIDLAGWICESLNVVDYFVHPRQYLKNLFFRACFLLMEDVVPVFVLEGTAPKLKEKVIAKRNELQFRGVKPRDHGTQPTQDSMPNKKLKGRTRFNHVLKQCENLLSCMGIQCVQGPGEAEAYCAFLNKYELVNGVISQDSDCFAYGAQTVYRNFSISSQGNVQVHGGAIDVYDMKKICSKMDFGQNKVIIMALLCGCDYTEGVSGVGKETVLKFFSKYKNDEILDRIMSWRLNDYKYNELEMRVDDKNMCSYCGHLGKTASHTRSGCAVCKMSKGCNESLWKEARLEIKAELLLRKKALIDPEFPSQEILDEYFTEPTTIPKLNLNWQQPNMVKFIKQIGHLLQWTEIYSFQKFLPLLTRWEVSYKHTNFKGQLFPECIHKKRTLRGIPSYEIVWKDTNKLFDDLIPEEQIKLYLEENPKGIQSLWSTIEPADKVVATYPDLVETYLKSIEKPKKTAGKGRKKKNDSLNNMKDLIDVTNEVSKELKKPKNKKPIQRKGLQLIDKFFIKHDYELAQNNRCSTPKSKINLSSLDFDDDDDCNLSAVIKGIITGPKHSPLRTHNGNRLIYPVINNMSINMSVDDLALLPKKRNLSSSLSYCQSPKRLSKDEQKFNRKSIDDMILIDSIEEIKPVLDDFDRYLVGKSDSLNENYQPNVSYFFGCNTGLDEFEKSLDISYLKDF